MTTTRGTHYPGRCEPGSTGAYTCPICAPYYRAERQRYQAADAARKARYGSTSCPDCGKVYRVDEQGHVEDHAANCKPMTAEKILGL